MILLYDLYDFIGFHQPKSGLILLLGESWPLFVGKNGSILPLDSPVFPLVSGVLRTALLMGIMFPNQQKV